MDQFSVTLHKKHLVPDLIPMTGMKEKLAKGLEFLDVGCGSGFHVCELGKLKMDKMIAKVFKKI